MKNRSSINTYSTSTGERLSSASIERKVRQSKADKLEEQIDQHGYNFCQECKRNDCKPLDCSHIISEKEAKQSGRAELCFDLNNLEVLGRRCHMKIESLSFAERTIRFIENCERR